MLNVAGGSKNFGADNDLECEATQLGKKGSRPTVFSEQSTKDSWPSKDHLKGISLTSYLESNKLIDFYFW